MRLKQEIPARLAFGAAITVALCLSASDRQVFAFEQQRRRATAPVLQTLSRPPPSPLDPRCS